MAGAPNDSRLLWLNVDGTQQAPAGTMRAQSHKLLNKHGVGVLSARWRGQRINGALLRWHNGRSNMHRASLSVVNTAHCPATTSVALMWVSAEGWLRSNYVLHT